MEMNILEESKHRVVVAIDGENHAMLGALTKELWQDSHVKNIGYTTEHPLIGKHQLVIETDGADPHKTLSGAAKKLAKTVQKLRDDAAKALK